MRLTTILEFRKGAFTGYVRRGGYVKNRDRVPFKQMLPIELRNHVSGKSDKPSGSVCVQEMSLLFACLKKNEFNNSKCAKELDSFRTCYTNQIELKKSRKTKQLTGGLDPAEKRLSHRQLNELLQKYPS